MLQKRFSAEHTIAKLCRIEGQSAQGKCLALACKDTAISRAGVRDECLKLKIFCRSKEA
jgi:hypothetical protein